MVNAEVHPLQYIRGLDVTLDSPPEDVSPAEMPHWAGKAEPPEGYQMARIGRLTIMWPTALNDEMAQATQTVAKFACSKDVVDEALWCLAAAIIVNAPSPWVDSGDDGGIGIQWDTEKADLYIDIVPGEDTTYALTPKAGLPSDGTLNPGNLLEVLSHIAR